MAYNNGYPASYAPYFTPVQPQQNYNGLIWVASEDEANRWFVAPNTAVALWNKADKLIYVKSADALGMTSMKKLKYEFVEDKPAEPPMGEYVSKADFDALAEQVKKLQQGDK